MNTCDFTLIVEIAHRAHRELTLNQDHMTTIMDIEHAHEDTPLRLADLLDADSLNFSHDIYGIIRNINRKTGKLDNFFVPRYAQ